jgi:hypothetical protein
MPLRRSIALAALFAGLGACASAPSRPSSPAPAGEITFDLSSPPAVVRDQLVSAFNEHGLPVSTSQPGVIEFHAAREKGILGYYEVFARAVIVPQDCGTRVTLFGEETHYANAFAPQGTAVRIGPSSTGRARDIWTKLESVAARVHGNPSVSSGAHSN